MRQLFMLLILLLTLPAVLGADLIGVSALGVHPNSQAFAYVYTHDASGTVSVTNALTGQLVTTITLQKPKDNAGQNINCLGNLECLEADLSNLAPGTYKLTYKTVISRPFTVSDDVYKNTIPQFLEFFNAQMMQDSDYHAQYFGYEVPAYTMMADGAFLMESPQASIPLIRLSDAYRTNPQAFGTNAHNVLRSNEYDGVEYIVAHVDYLRSLQAYNGKSNIYDMPVAYTQPWGPFFTSDPSVPQYTDTKADFLYYDYTINKENTAQATYAYLSSLPAVNEYDHAKAVDLLSFSLDTLTYLENKYPGTGEEYAAYLGAAYFRAYDFTGDWHYVEKAYALRDQVSQTLVSDSTKGNEFYWKEYLDHEDEIVSLGFQYSLGGTDPAEVFRGKLYFDYKDRGSLSIAQNAERAYDFDRNVQFSNSRYMLLEGVFASEALEHSDDAFLNEIADAQLAWLTGANAVQHSKVNYQLNSVSFINGIGAQTAQIHSRITPPGVRAGTQTFMNGMTYIPGWVNGAFDANTDSDIIRNYNENYQAYWNTETTNEMVSLGLQLAALRDAHYNNRAPVADFILIDRSSPWPNREPYEEQPPTTVPTECSTSLASAVASCIGGSITSDIAGGCRTVVCSSAAGSLQILACDKASFFEMYKQGQSDPALNICLDGTCIGANGYVKSNDYASCAADPGVLTLTINVINDNGGALDASDMSVLVDGTATSGSIALQPGTYQVEPVAVSGYDASLGGACVSGAVVIGEAQSSECVVTFDDRDPSADICYDDFASLPASCVNGQLTVDSDAGCRTLRCDGASGFVAALACPKSGFFEMYKQGGSGSVDVCLGGVCLDGQGFAKSPSYPLCVAPPAVCTDADGDTYAAEGGACGPLDCRDDNSGVNPAGTEMCNGIDDDCDGVVDEGGVCSVCGNGVVEEGEECDDGNLADGDLCSAVCKIERNASVSLLIAPWFPQGKSYVFVCDAEGFVPTRYDFDFGDGNTNNYRTTHDVYYTYAASGDFDVSCTAYGEGEVQTSVLAVSVA